MVDFYTSHEHIKTCMPDISKDKKLLKYFKKRHLEQASQENYILVFKAYYRATGLTPTEAYLEADDEEENGVRLTRRKIVERLDDFEDYLEEMMKESTLKAYMSIVRSFYRFHFIQLPDSMRRSPNPTPEESLTDLPDEDDIKKAIDFADIKYKAIIILLASSGMRQGDARSLTLKHLVNALNEYAKIKVEDLSDIGAVRDMLPEQVGPLRWDMWMEKKKRYYTCFSTPESLDYILKYLDHHHPMEYTGDTFLFRSRQTNAYIVRNTLNSVFEDLNTRCDFPIQKNGYIFFRPHNLRKWFGNQLKKTALGYTDTRHLMGHRVRSSTSRSYLKPDYVHLRGLYYKNMDSVTLFGKVEVHDVTDEVVKEQSVKIDQLTADNVYLKKEIKMIKELQNQAEREK